MHTPLRWATSAGSATAGHVDGARQVADREVAGTTMRWCSDKNTLGDETSGPTERLRRLFDETAAWQTAAVAASGVAAGCLFGRLALELSDDDVAVRHRIRAIFDEQIEMLAAAIDETSPGRRTDEQLTAAARAVLAQLEGLVMFVRLFNDPAHLDSMWTSASRILGLTDGSGV